MNQAHTGDMKKLLLALFLVGCGADGGTNYDVRIGSLNPAQCTGYMHLDGTAGYWRCEFIGGDAKLDLSSATTTGTLFLDLETTPGFFNRVRATYDGPNISGQILIDDVSTAFFATQQQ